MKIAMLLVGAACALAAGTALGNDRPFQVARTAVLEDEAHTWSFESWVQRRGNVRGLSFEPEYTFGSGASVQVELSRFVDRDGAETGHEGEVEFKQVFNDIARDGWGWGISAALGAERTRAEGTVRSLGLKVPLSIAIGEGSYLHLDAGVDKAGGSRRAWSTSAAVEHEMVERLVAYAEVAREGEVKFAQVGARYWLRREHLAIDFSLQQQRRDGRRSSGFILGLGWYDL